MTILDVEKIFDIIQIIELTKVLKIGRKSQILHVCEHLSEKSAYVWTPSTEFSRQEYWSG